jgi:hypothetical protein
MRISNQVPHEYIVKVLNYPPDPDPVEFGRRIEHYAECGGKVSVEERNFLIAIENSRWLRIYVDEWLTTGVDRDGNEDPYQRNPFRTNRARRALLEYMEQHPPTVSLSHRHGLEILIGEPTELPTSWDEIFMTAKIDAERLFAALILRDGNECLGKCGYCGRYFWRKPHRKGYKYGVFCCAAHNRMAAAVKHTDQRRMRVESKLIRFAASKLQVWRVRGPEWQHDKKQTERLADAVRKHLRDSTDPELIKYHEVVRVKVGWVTRHKNKIEQARLQTPSGQPAR